MAALKDRKMLVEGRSFLWPLTVKGTGTHLANVGLDGRPYWGVSKLSQGLEWGGVLILCTAGAFTSRRLG